ncbi:MAG: hypothetical protein FWH23_06175 [Bacteroidales bacterium]|nr:hypothetical protein [Bacteroidales bacterium]
MIKNNLGHGKSPVQTAIVNASGMAYAILKTGTNAGAAERIFVERLHSSGLSVMRSRNMPPANARWQVVEWRNNGVATKDCN